ncbi:MAG: serine/threonine protein kinase [Halioglobus sp.]|nr:serine/threonine protein kinase [Halioglobus sp.]
MPEFRQHKAAETPLYAEETDAVLPEKLNPNTRYAYFSTIAKGGKSLIKSCRDLHLRRTVCYKTLRPEFVDDPIENQRLVREARISAALQHPNTVPTYELGRDNRGHYYFTMKLVHGYTLRQVLDYRERYDLTQLMKVIEQVGQALGYAHSMGVLHRDIKPDNILIGPYGEVLLLDWGLAKVWNKTDFDAGHTEAEAEAGMTGEGKLQGTVMYMSPEQTRRDPDIALQSDLYSLGALLYETLTGTTPFQGDIVHALLEQIRTQLPPDPRTVSSQKVPDVLADLAMQCLQKDPAARPESAEKLVRIIRHDWLDR